MDINIDYFDFHELTYYKMCDASNSDRTDIEARVGVLEAGAVRVALYFYSCDEENKEYAFGRGNYVLEAVIDVLTPECCEDTCNEYYKDYIHVKDDYVSTRDEILDFFAQMVENNIYLYEAINANGVTWNKLRKLVS